MKKSLKRKLLLMPTTVATLSLLAIGASAPAATAADNDVIKDAGLRACINNSYNERLDPGYKRSVDAPLSAADVKVAASKNRNGVGGSFQCTPDKTGGRAIKDLSGLGYSEDLERLTIVPTKDTNRKTSNGHTIKEGPALSARLSNDPSSHLEELKKLHNLKNLVLTDNNLTAIPDLTGMTSLKTLSIDGNGSTDYGDIDPSRASTKGITSLKGIELATNLENLNADYSDINSIAGVEKLTKLKVLKVSHNQILNVAPLKSIQNLEDLRVDSNHINDLSPVAGHSKLSYLEIESNEIADISALANKPLTYIDMDHNKVSNISVLGTLKSLKSLDISSNAIADLSPLGSLTLTSSSVSPQTPAENTVTNYLGADGKTHLDISGLSTISGSTVSVLSVTDSQKKSVAFTVDSKNKELILDGVYNRWLRVTYKSNAATDANSTTDVLAPAKNVVTPTPTTGFVDVSTNRQFYKEINWLASTGITTGYSDGTFRPDASVNRDAMAAFFYRMAGSPEFTAPAVSPFKDVKPGDQFYKEVTWMASQGITTGYSDGTFRPRQSVDRDAMAAFFYRFAGKPAYTAPATSPFKDINTGTPFYKEMSWLASKNISTGWKVSGGAEYRPWNTVNRETMAAFIYRYNTNVSAVPKK